jgi:hypothetical protein
MGQEVAHEMHAAALPSGMQYLGDRGLQSLMGIRDHELDAAQAAPSELAQELGPEGLGFRRADVQAQHFAPAIAIDADRDDDRHRDDAAGLAHFHIGRIEPDIGPITFQRSVEEGLHLVVDLAAQPADLALGDAGHAHRLDQIIDRAGRHALHVSLLDDGGERLLGHAPRLQKAREVAALAELWDAQLDRAGARLPHPVAVAVAVIEPVGLTHAMRGAGQSLDLKLHQPLRGKADHLAQQIGVRALLQKRAEVHHIVGHRRVLGSR